MRKIFFIIFFLQISFNSFSSEIAILDVDALFKSSAKGKSIILELTELNNEYNKNIKKQEKIIVDLDKEIQSKKNIMDENEIKTKVDQMNILLKDLEILKKQSIKSYEEKKNQELNVFFNKITPIVKEFMEKNSINILIDKKNIFISNQKNDITEELLKIIDKNLK